MIIDLSKRNIFNKINIPLFLLLSTQIFNFIDYQQSTILTSSLHEMTFKTYVTGIWFFYLFVFFVKNLFHLNFSYILICYFFGLVCAYNIIISFNTWAALESLIKMSFPILAVIYGMLQKKSIKEWANGLIFLTVINDLIQFLIYLIHFTGYYSLRLRTEGGFLIRAEGLSGFVSFAVMNFISAIIIEQYYKGKYKNLIFWFFVTLAILPFLFKLFPILLIFLLYINFKKNMKFFFTGTFIIIALSIIYGENNFFYRQYLMRINTYSLYGDSVRAQSYQAAKKSIIDNYNFFGEGLGSFGGPASIKYNSPLYQKYGLNFGWLKFLSTTDTYYPHLLIEIGLVGFLLFFALITYPIIKVSAHDRSYVAWFSLIIPLNNAFTSFSIEDPTTVMFTFTLIPMILEQEKFQKSYDPISKF